MKTVLEITESLRKKGYEDDFEIKGEKIRSKESGILFSPDELIIESLYRYEGDSNPSDNAIIYAITSNNGSKGVLVDAYGAYADVNLAKIISAIPVREVHEMQDTKES